jgi:hypothetical protein
VAAFRGVAPVFRTGEAVFGAARFLADTFGAAAFLAGVLPAAAFFADVPWAEVRLAAAFFFAGAFVGAFFMAGAFALRAARLRVGGASAALTGAATLSAVAFRLEPDLAIPPIPPALNNDSIDVTCVLFQGAGTKLIAEGLPIVIVTPVEIRLPVGSSMWNAVIRSLSWLPT